MFRKKKKINELKPGDKVDDVFVVKIKRDFRPYKNGYSFRLILSDASGRSIEFVYWGGSEEGVVRRLYDQVGEDDVVRITGRVGKYRGALQVSSDTTDVFRVLREGEFDPLDFVLPPNRDPEEMFSELLSAVKGVRDEHIRALLESVFTDPGIEAEIKRHPGGIEIHHNRYGGLLEHELEVLEYCRLSAKFFGLDGDLLTAGALLHDIGKLEELKMGTRIKATRSGMLLGHIVQGVVFLSQKMGELDTPPLLQEKILHIVASHHGFNDFGSPKEPMFPEALAVHLADMLSSKLGEMKTFMGKVDGMTKDEFAYYRRGKKNILLR